jgi:GxxExxY protein
MDVGYRLDLVVEERVISELKSVEALEDVHFKQINTYLKLSDLKLGILVNFNTDNILKSIHRRVHNLPEEE